MTTKQFRTALARLNLSQLGAARLFEVDARTVRRWALAERAIPSSVAILLHLLLAGKITIADIEAAHAK